MRDNFCADIGSLIYGTLKNTRGIKYVQNDRNDVLYGSSLSLYFIQVFSVISGRHFSQKHSN